MIPGYRSLKPMNSIERYDELRKNSLPGMLLERAERTKECIWAGFKDRVAVCALGLRELGLQQGVGFTRHISGGRKGENLILVRKHPP